MLFDTVFLWDERPPSFLSYGSRHSVSCRQTWPNHDSLHYAMMASRTYLLASGSVGSSVWDVIVLSIAKRPPVAFVFTLKALFFCVVQDYENRITTLQEQLERHSVMSSMYEDFDASEYEDHFGETLPEGAFFCKNILCPFLHRLAARKLTPLVGELCETLHHLSQFSIQPNII